MDVIGMSTNQFHIGQNERSLPGGETHAAPRYSFLASIGRIVRATLLAIVLTGIFLIPSLLTHIALGLVAPISSGYMTGRLRRLSGGEATAIGLILVLCVGLPAPIAQSQFGAFSQLSSVAIVFLSGVVAIYYGALVAIAAWYGGHLVREEDRDD
jgi:hypothetical protein